MFTKYINKVEKILELGGANFNLGDKRSITALHHAVFRTDKDADVSFEIKVEVQAGKLGDCGERGLFFLYKN